LAWQTGEGGFRRAVALREVPPGAEVSVAPPAQEGVLPLLDLIELEGKKWAVYEFVPGATFAEVAAAHFSVERLPSLGLIGRIVVDACLAIHRVHTWSDPLGLIGPQKHGGLSDASVFIGFDGLTRVLDLNARRPGKFVAPEVTRGDAFDLRADVFSLGALMHHAATRFEKAYAATMARAPSPSEFPPPSAVHPEASPKLDAVVMRALMASPGGRFASAGQLAEELEKVLGPILFTREQVSAVLLPLFGDRMSALKDLVDPKKRPPPPKGSAPRPSAPTRPSGPTRPSANRNALDEVSSQDVKLDGGAGVEIEDMPTQSNIRLKAIKPGPPIPDFDPHTTKPGRISAESSPRLTDQQFPATDIEVPRPSGPKRIGQADIEKARARGQEKISTADFSPEDMPEDLRSLQGNIQLDGGGLGEVTDEPTNIKPRLTGEFRPPPEVYEDPKKRESTMDVDRSVPASTTGQLRKVSRRGPKVVIALLTLMIVGMASVVALRPDLLERIKSRLRPPVDVPPQEVVLEDVLEDGGLAGGVVLEGDGGEAPDDAGPAPIAAVLRIFDAGPGRDAGPARDGGSVRDAGSPDAGSVRDAGKPVAPTKATKKKKKRGR
jgi:hypothetical protein